MPTVGPRVGQAASAQKPEIVGRRGPPTSAQIEAKLAVLKGEMSVVGPRPHALSHDAQWAKSVSTYGERFRVRPGLRGRAQVLGHRGEVTCVEAIAARVAADNTYIETWSFAGDLMLILRTVPLLFGDAQAF
ncbi:sugar transferase [Phenylobacterium sp.]|uniref:sugar transferase n=1 Tax=Phenylobacterium sp. TaxID=1871053 RepID=UPI002E2FCD6C|nr:sugar transferase [Phenylobacterium sp.]HEX3367630.1 sugar transferase [Phenylobacterium sp.]